MQENGGMIFLDEESIRVTLKIKGIIRISEQAPQDNRSLSDFRLVKKHKYIHFLYSFRFIKTMEQDTKKTEQKEKLDFSSRDDFEKAKTILRDEGFNIMCGLYTKGLSPYSTMLIGGTEENIHKAFNFSINQG